MREPSAPLRVTWDLPAEAPRAAFLGRRLVEARVLSAQVLLRPGSLPGLPGLRGWGREERTPRLSLLGDPDALLAAVEVLGPRIPVEAELLVLPPYEPRLEVEELAAATARLVPALWADPEGLGELSSALEVARGYRLPAVAILAPPAPATSLGPAHRAEAARVWRTRGAPDLELRVHDLFLAEALGLDPFWGYGGCQAASELAHVDGEGRVWACRTLAEPLGSLERASLRELWASEARRGLRERLAASPASCAGCGWGAACRGGCRGLSPDLGRDPSCTGPRPRGEGP